MNFFRYQICAVDGSLNQIQLYLAFILWELVTSRRYDVNLRPKGFRINRVDQSRDFLHGYAVFQVADNIVNANISEVERMHSS